MRRFFRESPRPPSLSSEDGKTSPMNHSPPLWQFLICQNDFHAITSVGEQYHDRGIERILDVPRLLFRSFSPPSLICRNEDGGSRGDYTIFLLLGTCDSSSASTASVKASAEGEEGGDIANRNESMIVGGSISRIICSSDAAPLTRHVWNRFCGRFSR